MASGSYPYRNSIHFHSLPTDQKWGLKRTLIAGLTTASLGTAFSLPGVTGMLDQGLSQFPF